LSLTIPRHPQIHTHDHDDDAPFDPDSFVALVLSLHPQKDNMRSARSALAAISLCYFYSNGNLFFSPVLLDALSCPVCIIIIIIWSSSVGGRLEGSPTFKSGFSRVLEVDRRAGWIHATMFEFSNVGYCSTHWIYVMM